jgi:hypothetical protein
MFTPNTGYGHYRFRLNGVEVQAAQLTIYNLKHVSEWIRANGGATTGMLVRDQGEIARRGIWLGTITGDVHGAGEGDWMILSHQGFSVCPGERFGLLYLPADADEPSFCCRSCRDISHEFVQVRDQR